jgi:hypothetical protein
MSAKGSTVPKHGHRKDIRLVSGASRIGEQLSALASELLERRDEILKA